MNSSESDLANDKSSHSFKLRFDHPLEFNPRNFSGLSGIRGIYFILLTSHPIPYPFHPSRLIYIGMSDKTTNSIFSRLSDHYDGISGNFGLTNYRKVQKLQFTYLNFDVLKNIWKLRIEDLESYLLLNFVERFGVYPICNNRTGFPELSTTQQNLLNVDWEYFK